MRFTSTVNQFTQHLLPKAPANLVTANTTSSTTDLSWDAVVGASGYNVYQDGVLIDMSATATYTASGLQSLTEYEFFVTAIDDADTDADNESGPSNTVNVTTL